MYATRSCIESNPIGFSLLLLEIMYTWSGIYVDKPLAHFLVTRKVQVPLFIVVFFNKSLFFSLLFSDIFCLCFLFFSNFGHFFLTHTIKIPGCWCQVRRREENCFQVVSARDIRRTCVRATTTSASPLVNRSSTRIRVSDPGILV